MKIFLLIILLTLPVLAQLRVSEVHRLPVGGRVAARAHQFIEIVNLGDETVDVSGKRLFTGAIFNNILALERGAINQGITGTTEILAGQKAIIISREIIQNFEEFRFEIPDDVVVLTVNLITIAGAFAANDGFVILNAENDTVAEFRNAFENGRFKVYPTSAETEGFSLIPETLFENSGAWNVQRPNLGDIRNFNFGVLREYKVERVEHNFNVRILYRNLNRFASVQGQRLSANFGEINIIKPLAASLVFEVNIDGIAIFDTVWTANLFSEEGSVVISEVDARGSEEWIELYWTGECFPLENWHLIVGGSVVNLPRLECPANRILVISEREKNDFVEKVRVPNWRRINNFNDTIFLVAPFGVVDSIAFSNNIFSGSSDRSTVQRRDVSRCGFDPDNVFAGVANPGAVLRFAQVSNFSINLSARRFTPNGDGHLDSLIITANKPRNGNVKIEIYNMSGNLLRTFESNSKTRFAWDGRNESGRIAPVGPVFVIATFEGGGRRYTYRQNAVLWR